MATIFAVGLLSLGISTLHFYPVAPNGLNFLCPDLEELSQMASMLEVEGQLEAAGEDTKSVAAAESEAGYAETASAYGGESFYSNTKKGFGS